MDVTARIMERDAKRDGVSLDFDQLLKHDQGI
jgi:hypothetical protein